MFLFKTKEKYLDNFGVVQDPRSKKERQMDFRVEELYSALPKPKWEVIHSLTEIHKFPIFDQDSSGSCLAQATAKALGIENFLEEEKFVAVSARDIYSRRRNKSVGMWLQDALHIAVKHGGTLEQLMPSQKKPEAFMSTKDDETPLTNEVAKILRARNYVMSPIDMDSIAVQIESSEDDVGKPIILTLKFGPGEWNYGMPKIKSANPSRWYYHGVVAREAFLWKGLPVILIEDSWEPKSGFDGIRLLTEDWWGQNRITGAGYFIGLPNVLPDEKPQKPKYRFERNLCWGMKGQEIKNLQTALRYLSIFPGAIDITGNFYGITLKSVKLFQETYRKDIEKVLGHSIHATGFVGPGTRAILNKIFK